MQWLSSLGATFRFVPLILTSVAFFNLVRSAWRASIGRSRSLRARCRSMAPHVRHAYVASLFGEPAWEYAVEAQPWGVTSLDMDESIPFTVRVWTLGALGYLTTWTQQGTDTVLMYAVTTRSRLFRPKIVMALGSNHPVTVRLGKSRLADVASDIDPSKVYAAVGASTFSYAETHYLGNPGGYCTWAVGNSMTGLPTCAPRGVVARGVVDARQLADYRARAIVNSVLVSGHSSPAAAHSSLDLASILPTAIGPDYQRVRLVEDRAAAWRRFTNRMCWRLGRHSA